MSNIDSFKKQIRESLSIPLGLGQSMREKLDPHVDELAGSLIAAGPQKCAEAIGKMDPATFAEFAKKIDADGILMVTKQFATAPNTSPETDAAPATGAEAGSVPAPAAPAVAPEDELVAKL